MPKLSKIKEKVIPIKLENFIAIDIPYYFNKIYKKGVEIYKGIPFRLNILGKDIETKLIDISAIPTRMQIKRIKRKLNKRTRFYMDNKAATFYIKQLKQKLNELELRIERTEQKNEAEEFKNYKKKLNRRTQF